MIDWQAIRPQILAGTTNVAELVDQCLSRIRARNQTVNAFLEVDEQGARAAALESDQRYRDGAPLSAKSRSNSVIARNTVVEYPNTKTPATRMPTVADATVPQILALRSQARS